MSREEDDTQPFVRLMDEEARSDEAVVLSDEDFPSPRPRRPESKPGLWRRFCNWLTGGPWPDPDTDEEAAAATRRQLSEGQWQEPSEYVRHEQPKHSVQPVQGTVDMERVAQEIAGLRCALAESRALTADLKHQLDEEQARRGELLDELAVAKRLLKVQAAKKKKKPSGKRTKKTQQ